MSARLVNRFVKERSAGRHLFVPFVTAGDHGLTFTKQAILALAEAGADAIELGVPFSDPLADGPVIQHASQRALEQGTTLEAIFTLVRDIRRNCSIPIILMGYYNPFLQPSLQQNMKKASQAGVDGLIIPDLPPEEAEEVVRFGEKLDLDIIFLAAPTSTTARLKKIGALSGGYVYYVSVTGTTGVRQALAKNIKQGVNRVKQYTSLPVLVGFGIANADQAQQVCRYADGVIVGSALIKVVENAKNDQDALRKLTNLAKSIIKIVKDNKNK